MVNFRFLESRESWSNLPPEFKGPALVGLAVVVATIVLLLLISDSNWRKLVGGRGSAYVRDGTMGHVVRRSLRSAKKPDRWEPPLIKGEPAAQSPVASIEKAVTRAVRSPRNTIKEAIKSVTDDAPSPKARGRPKKADQIEPKSPRRGTKSPSPSRVRRVKSPRS